MNVFKKFWPHAYKANDVVGLIVAIVIYTLMNLVCGVIGWVIGFVPLLGGIIGAVWGIVGWLVGIYAAVGVLVALLHFLKILK